MEKNMLKKENKIFKNNIPLNLLSKIYCLFQSALPNPRVLIFKTYLPFLEEKVSCHETNRKVLRLLLCNNIKACFRVLSQARICS